MRQGVRFAVDVGARRIGVARADTAVLAVPVTTLEVGSDIAQMARLVAGAQTLEVIVGLPLNMDGSEGKSAKMARRWARRLARRIAPIPVRLFDERLSTVQAHRQLHEVGRKEITHRSVIDQAAAVIILDSAMEYERLSGAIPGELVPAKDSSV